MIACLAALVFICLAGGLGTRVLVGRSAGLWLTLVLGAGLGIGAASCFYFLALKLMPQHSAIAFWLVSLFTSALLAVVIWRSKPESEISSANESLPVRRGFVISAVVLFCVAVASFCCDSWLHPHSDWDALMIWNVRARFLERAPLDLAAAFSPLIFWSHPDYPVLLPSIVGLLLSLSDESQLAPLSVAFVFTLAAPLLLAGYFQTFAPCANEWDFPQLRGWLAASVLLTTPYWLHCGAMMYGDVPIAFYLLAVLVCCALYDRLGRAGYLILAGIFAGLAAWTKNEGLMFLPLLLVANCLAGRGFAFSGKAIVAFLCGAAPVLSLLVWFKLGVPANDIVAGNGSLQLVLGRLFDPARLLIVAEHFLVESVTFGDWLVSPIPLLCLVFWIYKCKISDTGGKRALFVCLLMVLGYGLVFMVTPSELRQHLLTAANRLFLQIWPTFIFSIFSANIGVPIQVRQPKPVT